MNSLLANRLSQVKPSKISAFFDKVSETKGAISLSIGEPDFPTPWHIADAGIASIEEGNTFYTSDMGLLELREAISSFLKRHYSLSYSSEEILVTVGASEAIDLAIRSLVNPKDEVILLDPSYVSYLPCVQLVGGVPTFAHLSEEHSFKLQVRDLDKVVTSKSKVLILNYPHNPTGAIMSKEELAPICDYCYKHHIFIISDEIYAELTYGAKHCSVGTLANMKDSSLIINGLSKAFSMTGWRLGYAAGPTWLIEAMKKIHQYTTMCPSSMSQYAGIEAMTEGEEDIKVMRDEYQERLSFVLSKLQEMKLPCFTPAGAFYVFPCIKEFGLTSEEFCERLLKEEKVAVIPGDAFGEAGEGFIRISYAYSVSEIKVALSRIEKFISSLRKRSL